MLHNHLYSQSWKWGLNFPDFFFNITESTSNAEIIAHTQTWTTCYNIWSILQTFN